MCCTTLPRLGSRVRISPPAGDGGPHSRSEPWAEHRRARRILQRVEAVHAVAQQPTHHRHGVTGNGRGCRLSGCHSGKKQDGGREGQANAQNPFSCSCRQRVQGGDNRVHGGCGAGCGHDYFDGRAGGDELTGLPSWLPRGVASRSGCRAGTMALAGPSCAGACSTTAEAGCAVTGTGTPGKSRVARRASAAVRAAAAMDNAVP